MYLPGRGSAARLPVCERQRGRRHLGSSHIRDKEWLLKKKDLPAQEINDPHTPGFPVHPCKKPNWDGSALMRRPVFIPFPCAPRSNIRLPDLPSSARLSSNARVPNSTGFLVPAPFFAISLARLKIAAPSDYAIGVFLIPPRMRQARNNWLYSPRRGEGCDEVRSNRLCAEWLQSSPMTRFPLC